jgi:hypothetical protein
MTVVLAGVGPSSLPSCLSSRQAGKQARKQGSKHAVPCPVILAHRHCPLPSVRSDRLHGSGPPSGASSRVGRCKSRNKSSGDAPLAVRGATAVEAASLTQNCLYERYIAHGTYSTVFKVCMQAAGALDRACNCTHTRTWPAERNETIPGYSCTAFVLRTVCMLALSRVTS